MGSDITYDIEVTGAEGFPDANASAIRHAIETALRRRACGGARIVVALVGDAVIADLNRRYLGHEGPTDVLSFDLSDAGVPGAVDGEIVLSHETARREAAARGHAAEHEMLLYAIHGALHLTGMDDRSESGAADMHGLEDAILLEMGIGPVYHARVP